MITVLITIVHVLVSILMIVVILLQAGKGAEIGAAFGGSSQTIFGSRGAATFLSKMTVATATVFMLTSLTLSILSFNRSVVSSIVDEHPLAAPAQRPAATDTPVEPDASAPSPGF